MIDRLFYSALAVSGAAAVTVATPSPYAWIAPIICGCFAALIVRGISITTPSKAKKVWAFEGLVTALSVLVSGVVIEERGLTIMYATFAGMGIGGLGVGIISITRTALATVIKNIALSVLSNGAVALPEDAGATAQANEAAGQPIA